MSGARARRLDALVAYAPAALEGVDLDLRDNINVWGAPPSLARVLEEARGAGIRELARYPAAGADELALAVARDAGVRGDEVVVGCGSDDIIDSFLRAATAPGDVLAHPEPTFGMIAHFARLNGLLPVGVPLLPDGAADIDGLLAVGAQATYLATPNNPTGTVTEPAAVRRLLERAPGAVLIDEAYAEFSDDLDWRALAPARPGTLVTRTFSKAWGLAGLRVGYGVGDAALCAAVAKARGPYKVNALAIRAATAALAEDGAWMRRVATEAMAARGRLEAALGAQRGVRCLRSRGNFVFASVPGDAATVAGRFAERGIGVRAFPALPGLGESVRIGVAPEPALSRVVAAIEEVFA
jgi:histidinol-phosphate aminotransferase